MKLLVTLMKQHFPSGHRSCGWLKGMLGTLSAVETWHVWHECTNAGQPWRVIDILKTSVMISTVMCSRETLQNTQVHSHSRSPVRIEPRRNSIPPTQAVTAIHLLAYLPRPQTESRPNTHKVQLVICCLCLSVLSYTKHVSVVSFCCLSFILPSSPWVDKIIIQRKVLP